MAKLSGEYKIISGHINGYDVIVSENKLYVGKGDKSWHHEIPGAKDVAKLINKPGFSLGWAAVEDMEIIYLYDKKDGFGYAFNLTVDYFSEWGTAPFKGGA